jgi:hypothetical protein
MRGPGGALIPLDDLDAACELPPARNHDGRSRCFCGAEITIANSDGTSAPDTGDHPHEQIRPASSLRRPGVRCAKAMEIANAAEHAQDGRIFIELLNGPLLYEHRASQAEYGAGLKLAIERGWLWKQSARVVRG